MVVPALAEVDVTENDGTTESLTNPTMLAVQAVNQTRFLSSAIVSALPMPIWSMGTGEMAYSVRVVLLPPSWAIRLASCSLNHRELSLASR